jgi:hypothetical protein
LKSFLTLHNCGSPENGFHPLSQLNKFFSKDFISLKSILYRFQTETILFDFYRVPFLALARTFSEIQKTRARLQQIDILKDYYLAVIIKSPNDLLPSILLATNQVCLFNPTFQNELSQSTIIW